MSSETVTAPPAQHLAHGEHQHPSDLQYIWIGIFLAVVTGAEVGLYYVDIGFLVNTISLLVLMIVKFATVAMFFMHLRFDSRVFRYFFVAGLLLAAAVYLIVLTTFHFWSGG